MNASKLTIRLPQKKRDANTSQQDQLDASILDKSKSGVDSFLDEYRVKREERGKNRDIERQRDASREKREGPSKKDKRQNSREPKPAWSASKNKKNNKSKKQNEPAKTVSVAEFMEALESSNQEQSSLKSSVSEQPSNSSIQRRLRKSNLGLQQQKHFDAKVPDKVRDSKPKRAKQGKDLRRVSDQIKEERYQKEKEKEQKQKKEEKKREQRQRELQEIEEKVQREKQKEKEQKQRQQEEEKREKARFRVERGETKSKARKAISSEANKRSHTGEPGRDSRHRKQDYPSSSSSADERQVNKGGYSLENEEDESYLDEFKDLLGSYDFSDEVLIMPTIQDANTLYMPRIFKKVVLKKFLNNILLEEHPTINVAANTVEYYAMIFNKFILEKDVFEFWKLRSETMLFNGWPEAHKMDHFIYQCWNSRYEESDLEFLYR